MAGAPEGSTERNGAAAGFVERAPCRVRGTRQAQSRAAGLAPALWLALAMVAAGAQEPTKGPAPVASETPNPRPRAVVPPPAEDYVARFSRALDDLDAGRHVEAAQGFRRAGERAPDAPVWRMHAAVAYARAGRPDEARAHVVAALARGYPLSDLAALAVQEGLPVPLDVVCEVDTGTWTHATIRGLAGVRGDTASARFVPDSKHPDLPTHLVGEYVPGSLGALEGLHRVEAYVVERAAGRIVPAEYPGTGRVRRDPLIPAHRLTFRNDHEPWPRAIPLVRAFRSGLLADGLEWVDKTVAIAVRIETGASSHSLVVVGGFEWKRPQESARWSVPRRPRAEVPDTDGARIRVGYLGPDRPVLRALDGRVVLDPLRLGLGKVVVHPGGELVAADGNDALFLFRGHDLTGDGTPEPFVTLWWHGPSLVAVAQDGTWSLPRHAVATARVVLGDCLVPAAPLAPWLLDPLHVRTVVLDEDPAPRCFPAP